VYFGLFLAGVDAETPAVVTTQVEARVNSDNERQLTDQTSALDNNSQDMTSLTEELSEIQRVHKSTIDRDMEDGQTKVLTGPSGDKDIEDSRNKTRSESSVSGDLEGGQNKPENISDSQNWAESAVSGNLEGGQNKPENTPDYGKNLEDVWDEVPVETIVETGTRAEMLTGSQEQSGSDGVEEMATEDGEMMMDDSGGDGTSEEQFLSPAASDPDISERSSPTMELTATEPGDIEDHKPEDREPISVENSAGETKKWSSKVPLIETEPPAMDSDYEEAPSLDTEERPLTSEDRRQSSGELDEEEHGKLNVDENSSDTATPVATGTEPGTATVKSTAM